MNRLRIAVADADDEPLTPAAVIRRERVWRVLVAEDHPDGLADRLAEAGYQVTVCPVAETAAAAEITRPHLILVDAKAAGWEAVRRVRARGWGSVVRVVALGGWDTTDRRGESAAAGCDGHLLQPVGEDEVACLLGGWDDGG